MARFKIENMSQSLRLLESNKNNEDCKNWKQVLNRNEKVEAEVESVAESQGWFGKIRTGGPGYSGENIRRIWRENRKRKRNEQNETERHEFRSANRQLNTENERDEEGISKLE